VSTSDAAPSTASRPQPTDRSTETTRTKSRRVLAYSSYLSGGARDVSGAEYADAGS
jgi:hypothetical protein